MLGDGVLSVKALGVDLEQAGSAVTRPAKRTGSDAALPWLALAADPSRSGNLRMSYRFGFLVELFWRTILVPAHLPIFDKFDSSLNCNFAGLVQGV